MSLKRRKVNKGFARGPEQESKPKLAPRTYSAFGTVFHSFHARGGVKTEGCDHLGAGLAF